MHLNASTDCGLLIDFGAEGTVIASEELRSDLIRLLW